jgi:malonyl-CoA/methylmalonyl-CoA synthetase
VSRPFLENDLPPFEPHDLSQNNHNLFAALRAAFPADLDAIAVETADTDRPTLNYSWRDLERATAMMANLLDSLKLPEGARVAVQVENRSRP